MQFRRGLGSVSIFVSLDFLTFFTVKSKMSVCMYEKCVLVNIREP